MHLSQHHFQTQNRYFEALAGFLFSSLFQDAYGFAGVELDSDALLNGTVVLTHARGIMPDGTPFHFPDEPAPTPLDVREVFSATQEAHEVLLAIPAYHPEQANCALDPQNGGSEVRYSPRSELVLDETTGQSPRSVSLGRKNFRLLLDVQSTDGLVTLAAARIRRDGAGHYIYDPDFIAPSTRIGASRRLLEMLGRLLEMLEAKAEAMAQERLLAGDPTEYATREVASFWLTHTVHAAIGPLRHLWQTRGAHPEQLYAELARLAGALCTFSMDADARTLPLYDHADPGSCFDSLERHIRRHLDVVLPSNCISVPLVMTEPGFFRGDVPDVRSLGRTRWFLGVRSGAGHGAVIADVPRLVKICSAEHIAKLVQRAYPGLVLEHVQVPPTALSPRIGMQYFAIQVNPPANSPGEPCWKLILDTSTVGVYVPSAIPDVEVNLGIVRETE